MNYIETFESFYNFAPNDGGANINELFSLNQSCMPKYTCEEFKNLFSSYLNESEEYMDDDSLNEAHAYYEIAMLSEARSSWGETEGDIHYVDAETHVILVKNSEAFIIEKKTLDYVQNNNLNEFKMFSFSDLKKAYHKLKDKAVDYAKKKISNAKEFVAKSWDKMSDGAKKAWEWMKTAVSASAKFVGDNLETITIVLTVLGSVLGIAGGILTAVGIGPILTAIAGGIMAINGGIHIYEGFHKIHHATEISKDVPVDPIAKFAAGMIKAGPDLFLGLLFLPLGFYDISHGLTEALANPAAGSIAAGVKETAKAASKSWLGNLGHTIEKVLGGFLKKFFANPKVGAAVGAGVVGGITILGAKFFTDVCGWLYEFMLKSSDSILKGINWLLDIPKKLTDAIDKFSKVADGFLSKIIAKGLSAIVKPMTSYLAKICEKYFKPLVDKSRKFIQRQIAAKKLLDAEMEKAHGGHGKGADNKKHGEIPKSKGKPLFKIGSVEIEKKDSKYASKVNKGIKKVKESQVWENKYIGSFDDLEFI